MPAKLVSKICEQCQVGFQGPRSRRYCSVKCTNEARHEVQDLTLLIRSIYIERDPEFGARALAKRFNTSHCTISEIIHNESYRS